jgi:hypothetical protein
MNGVKKVMLSGLACAGFAVAAGDLWQLDVDNFASLQVQVPGAIKCWAENEDPAEGNPCYEGTGGWWFTYVFGPEGVPEQEGKVFDATSGDDISAPKAMVLTSKADGSILSGKGITNNEGIKVRFELSGGGSVDDENPSGAGVGFNWRNKDGDDYEGNATEDISGKDGLCVVYSLEIVENADAKAWMELGWNEKGHGYNTWRYELDATTDATTGSTKDLAWSDFKKSWTQQGSPAITVATTTAEALKFKGENKSTSPSTMILTIKEVGWKGTCSGSTPIVTMPTVSASKFFSLTGRSLSFSAKGSVQIANIQGVVVVQKNLDANQTLNLANLPTGVYFVRSVEHGIVQKIMLK